MERVSPVRRIRVGLAGLLLVLLGGTVGYLALGFGPLDAVYQTVMTVTTVGFREIHPLSRAGEVFTIVLILVGVGTALYCFGVLLEALVEGHLRTVLRGRRMEREIAALRDHVIVCGWGRVGRAIGSSITAAGRPVVVVDREAGRLAGLPYPTVVGDVTDDETLRRAGIERAKVLVAALETDADNVYVVLSGRTLRPDLTIVARARSESSEAKLVRAGADRVVNPQRLGGDRMAAFALQPHVADFLEAVMHDGVLEIRLEEVTVAAGSLLAGGTIRDAKVREQAGALVLAVRDTSGSFSTNPDLSTVLEPGSVLIAVGTGEQVQALSRAAARPVHPSR